MSMPKRSVPMQVSLSSVRPLKWHPRCHIQLGAAVSSCPLGATARSLQQRLQRRGEQWSLHCPESRQNSATLRLPDLRYLGCWPHGLGAGRSLKLTAAPTPSGEVTCRASHFRRTGLNLSGRDRNMAESARHSGPWALLSLDWHHLRPVCSRWLDASGS